MTNAFSASSSSWVDFKADFISWRYDRPELKILLAGTPERTVKNAAELCGAGPMLKRPYEHRLVLDRIKRLLVARAQQGGR
jgi:hypothetical protein